MIVRNGAATLSACLESVAGLCEEMLVIDTGSEDDTLKIARSFGAKIINARWASDFSAARNAYIKQAAYPWVLSLDADEILGKVNKIEFFNALKRHPTTAFLFRIRNYFIKGSLQEPVLPSRLTNDGPEGFGCMITKTIRLFPRLAGIRYRYPVHESLLPTLSHVGVRVRRCAIPIHHFGKTQGRGNASAKAAMYRTLGQKKIAEFPNFFLGYLELGKVYFHQDEHKEAERMFRECIRLRPTCVEAYCFLAWTLQRQMRDLECREILQLTYQRFPYNADATQLYNNFFRKVGPI
jgi:glycosyltransferase involved in cell wall biosynthesis